MKIRFSAWFFFFVHIFHFHNGKINLLVLKKLYNKLLMGQCSQHIKFNYLYRSIEIGAHNCCRKYIKKTPIHFILCEQITIIIIIIHILSDLRSSVFIFSILTKSICFGVTWLF